MLCDDSQSCSKLGEQQQRPKAPQAAAEQRHGGRENSSAAGLYDLRARRRGPHAAAGAGNTRKPPSDLFLWRKNNHNTCDTQPFSDYHHSLGSHVI